MKRKDLSFRGIVALGAALSAVVTAVALEGFRAPEVSLGLYFLKIGLTSLAFVAAVSAVIGRFAVRFRLDFAVHQSRPETYTVVLDSLGKTPLLSLLIFIPVKAIYLTALFLLRDWIGLRPDAGLLLFLLIFSFGMFSGGLIYILSDKLVSVTLLSNDLVRYPRSLREARQQAKIFIIPAFMSLMSLTFAFSLSFLTVEQAGGNLRDLDGGALLVGALVTVVFFGAVLALMRIWNSNTGLIYRSIVTQMESLSSAEKDLTGRISIGSVDELGTIAGMVNDFCEGLAVSMAELKTAQDRLTGIGVKLHRSTGESAAAVNQISVGVGRVREKTHTQSSSVEGASAAVKQISDNIESLDKLIVDQSAGITESSASVEQMVGTIGSINESIEKMASRFGLLATATREGIETRRADGQRIGRIAERSEALVEANKVISVLASKTNLLAMNAAIEAAHAGQAGLGFSVVADEIRQLAETSAGESRKIKVELAQVRGAIDEMVEASADSEESFGRIAELIGATEALVEEVRCAVAEQRAGASQILEALREMNEITSQVRTGSKEMREGNGTVLDEMLRLQSVAREIREVVDEMATGADGVEGAARSVSETAENTRKTIDRMAAAIGCFKTARLGA